MSKPTLSDVVTRSFDTPSDAVRIVSASESLFAPWTTTKKWLEVLWPDSRGYELGTFQSQIVTAILQKQAEKWNILAMGYARDIICAVHHFILPVLREMVPLERARIAIASLLIESLQELCRGALEHTRFVRHVELGYVAATHNHYFNDELKRL